jgi:hypothetical protein
MKSLRQDYNIQKALDIYLCGLLLIASFVSIVLLPAVSVSVPSYMAIYLAAPFVLLASFRLNKPLLAELGRIVLVFAVLNVLAQLNNRFAGIQLNAKLTMVDNAADTTIWLRKTMFTQSFYLFSGILLYLYLKYYAKAHHVKYIYWSFRLLVVYGFFEVILFQFTGRNGDILSNREFNHVPGSGSLFQLMSIGGVTIQRLKSLTGEPSMFAFSVVPFWILAVGLKRRIDAVLFGIALLLSFSTSAFLGIFIFLCGLLVIHGASVKKYAWLIPAALLLFAALYYFSEAFHRFFNDAVWDKLTGHNLSGQQRGSAFKNQLDYWSTDLNFWGKLVGIGFGYTRSTDFFSTLLVNNGLAGVLVFTWFFFRPAFARMQQRRVQQYYVLALLATYVVMMVSVPEFAYLSTWILFAFPYFAERKLGSLR